MRAAVLRYEQPEPLQRKCSWAEASTSHLQISSRRLLEEHTARRFFFFLSPTAPTRTPSHQHETQPDTHPNTQPYNSRTSACELLR
jgi:hypothetical protein